MTGDERCVGPIGLLHAAPPNLGGAAAPAGAPTTAGIAIASVVARSPARTRAGVNPGRVWEFEEGNRGEPLSRVSWN